MQETEWAGVIVRLGVTIRDLRHLCGWSQLDLATRASVSQGTISRLESGHCVEVPLHSVVAVIRTLSAATRTFSIPRHPLVTALCAVTDACLPIPSLAPTVDPALLSLIHSFRLLLPAQRQALSALLDSFTLEEKERMLA